MVLSQALINAARDGDLAPVQEWLDAGGDPDDTTHDGETLLHQVSSAYDSQLEITSGTTPRVAFANQPAF